MNRRITHRQRRPDPFQAAKALMREAAIATVTCDPARVEKANRALAALRVAERGEATLLELPPDSACIPIAKNNSENGAAGDFS